MFRVIHLTLVASALFAPSMVLAGVADVSPALREQAETVCKDDAMRLCADAVPDESAIVTCLRPKRSELTPPCRKIFDEVVRAVGR